MEPLLISTPDERPISWKATFPMQKGWPHKKVSTIDSMLITWLSLWWLDVSGTKFQPQPDETVDKPDDSRPQSSSEPSRPGSAGILKSPRTSRPVSRGSGTHTDTHTPTYSPVVCFTKHSLYGNFSISELYLNAIFVLLPLNLFLSTYRWWFWHKMSEIWYFNHTLKNF